MSKLLFTGGAGYIGSHIIHCFLQKGIQAEDIVVVDDLSSGRKELLPEACHFHKIDINDEGALLYVFEKYEIDTVFHCAGLIQVEESMREPAKYFRTNSFGGLNLLEAMKKHGTKKIIFSSTAGVYGAPDYLPIDENHPSVPLSVYGESKLVFEKMLAWFDVVFGVAYVSLRYFNACGVGRGLGDYHNPYTHLIPRLAQSIIESKPFYLFGDDYQTPDGTCVRDFIDVRDLAEAHYAAYEYLNRSVGSDTFNLGSGTGHSVKEIIKLIEEASGKKVSVMVQKKRTGDPPQLVCSNEKAKKILNWIPEIDIKESVSSHWQWFVDNYGT